MADELAKLRTRKLERIDLLAQKMEEAARVMEPLKEQFERGELYSNEQHLNNALLNLRELRERFVQGLVEIQEMLERHRELNNASGSYLEALSALCNLKDFTATKRDFMATIRGESAQKIDELEGAAEEAQKQLDRFMQLLEHYCGPQKGS